MQVLRNRAIEACEWTHVHSGEPVPVQGDIIVDLATWQDQREALLRRPGRVGVRLQSEDNPEVLADDAKSLPLVAVDFPKFADGRGYSTGRILRERLGFTAELRATGDVLRDQLQYMERCGFDTFELKEGKDLQDAQGGFGEISVAYQAASDDARPLYRRR
jgi:uncharacterized protein (DUF934 family)